MEKKELLNNFGEHVYNWEKHPVSVIIGEGFKKTLETLTKIYDRLGVLIEINRNISDLKGHIDILDKHIYQIETNVGSIKDSSFNTQIVSAQLREEVKKARGKTE